MGQIAIRRIKRLTLLAGVLVAGTILSACSGTDVELKGGVFDLMGISGTGAKREEPKMANRAGLVIPPSTASLPPPGAAPTQPALAANGEAFPVNPEDAKKAELANVVDQHKAFCEKSRQRHEAGISPIIESSPWGSCEESVLRNFSGRDLAGNKAPGTQ